MVRLLVPVVTHRLGRLALLMRYTDGPRQGDPGLQAVASLFIYPIKSTAALKLTSTTVERRGLAFDRRWMVVNTSGRFLTQREQPKLALVRTKLEGGRLHVDAPGMPALAFGLTDENGPRRDVQVWRSRVHAASMGTEASTWFSDFLGVNCELVRLPETERRATNPTYSRDGDEVSFADGYPVLACFEASLQALNQKLTTPVPMSRFRPNLVIAGSEPFAEDRWKTLRAPGITFRVAKPCARCVVINHDQTTAEATHEPLATLATFRHFEPGVLFGLNLIPDAAGTLRVGDSLETH
jgi:uncharacterized protein YcbX